MATLANVHVASLLRLQTDPLPECFLRRYCVLCLGKVDTKAHCVTANWPDTVASSFHSKRDFALMQAAKYEAIDLALQSAAIESVLWLDTDVLVLRNPFGAMPAPRHPSEVLHQAEFNLPKYDTELANPKLGVHSANVNVGIMRISRAPGTPGRSFPQQVLRQLGTEWDQDVVNGILASGDEVAHTTMDGSTFASRCFSRNLDFYPHVLVKQRESLTCQHCSKTASMSLYHANCAKADETLEQKREYLQAVLEVVSFCRVLCPNVTNSSADGWRSWQAGAAGQP